MTNALPRAPESFYTPFTSGRHRTFPSCFGRLKMASALKPNGRRLTSSFNGGKRKITTLSATAKVEPNGGGNSLDGGGLISDDNANVNTLENDKIVHIWWDFGRCPLPLNFDAPKIASNITRALRHINKPCGPICFHGCGDFHTMWRDIVRFVRESGFQVTGFRLKERFGSSELYYKDEESFFSTEPPSPAIHIFITDGHSYEYDTLENLQSNGFILMPFEIVLAQ